MRPEQPYRVKGSYWTNKSAGGMDRTFPDLRALTIWLYQKFVDRPRSVRYRKLRVYTFNGERWERVVFEPQPITFRIDGEEYELGNWDDLLEFDEEDK